MKRASSLSIFSSLLLLCGALLLVFAVESYRKERHALIFVLNSLTGTYQISYQGRCLLPFRLQEASVRGGKKVLVGFGGDMPSEDNYFLFNDIGQLYKGVVQVQFGARKLHAEYTGVLDIELKIVGDLFERPFAFQQHIQGPITLEQYSDALRVRIPRPRGMQGATMDQSFPFTIEASAAQASCDASLDMLPSLPPFIERLLHAATTEDARS